MGSRKITGEQNGSFPKLLGNSPGEQRRCLRVGEKRDQGKQRDGKHNHKGLLTERADGARWKLRNRGRVLGFFCLLEQVMPLTDMEIIRGNSLGWSLERSMKLGVLLGACQV